MALISFFFAFVYNLITDLHDSCGSDMFQCNSTSRCISKDKICNKVDDCGDWSDEPKSCIINECVTNTTHCSHVR